jgi:hypothetical protein
MKLAFERRKTMPEPDLTFNTTPGQTVGREMLIAYLNTGESSTPTWSPIGKRVEDSSAEYDWQTETKVDIFGNTYTNGKKPTITQTFDPCELDADDAAQEKIWNLAIKDQNVNALMNQDMLIVHLYAGTAGTAVFAERYSSCSILPSGLGGEGGGTIGMPIDVTYGGTRTVGTASISGGTVKFTPGTVEV